MLSKQIVQTEKDIEVSLNQICDQVLKRNPRLAGMVLVGIRTGGVFLAERLRQKLLQKKGIDLPTGIIDITLYRDDWTRLSETPEVKKAEIHFSIEDKHVLLVDDVLFTGRTIRAAIDALLETAPNLGSDTIWRWVTNSLDTTPSTLSVTLPMDGTRFYRLRRAW